MKTGSEYLIRVSTCLAIVLGTVACTAPTQELPAPTVPSAAIQVTYLPSLEPALDAVDSCVFGDPGMALFLSETPASDFNPQSADITLWLGQPPGAEVFAVRLASEEIAIVVNAQNPVKEISQAELQAILRGEITEWDKVGGEAEDINVWVYPESNEVQTLAVNRLLPGGKISSTARIAPGPGAMVEAISGDPAGLGLLPLAWQNPAISEIQISDGQQIVREPVLAITGTEPDRSPQNPVYKFLLCLQGPTGRKALSRYYEVTSP
jgi:hypothetical protein